MSSDILQDRKKPEEFEKFDGLMKQLIHVPKAEMDAEVRKFKKRRAKKAKRKR
jgi:hypothetical protein